LGQTEKEDSSATIISIAAQTTYNSIWTERGSLQSFTQNHPWSMQLDVGVLHDTKKAWDYCHCFINSGFSFGYINFSNPNQLGRAITFSAFTEPYLLNTKRFQISLRGSAGFAFLNKVYDSITNKQPIFFSEKVSFLLSLGTAFSFRLNDQFKIKATAQFNHISNGGRKDPNEGLNFPGYGFALVYALHPHELKRKAIEPFTDRYWGVMAHLFGNTRTAFAGATWPEEKRILMGVNAGVIRRITRLNGIGAGGEIYYDGINAVYQQRSGRTLQTTVAAVSLQHYLFLGKLLFGQQLAWYVTPNTADKKLFQRYLLEYEVKRNWYAGVSLKATSDHSDFFALSVGRLIRL
jgi:hypothetical protein